MGKMTRKRVPTTKLSCFAMPFKADRQLGKAIVRITSFTNTLSLENPLVANPGMLWWSAGYNCEYKS